MNRMRLGCALASVSLLANALAADEPAALLTDATYAAVRDAVLPKPAELEWRKIGWRSDFWTAVVEAQRDEKPVLLWAMNGHPCGET